MQAFVFGSIKNVGENVGLTVARSASLLNI